MPHATHNRKHLQHIHSNSRKEKFQSKMQNDAPPGENVNPTAP